MDDLLKRRVVAASAASAFASAGAALALGCGIFSVVLALPSIGGGVLLSLGQLFRAASALRRSREFHGIKAHTLMTGCLAVVLTSLAVSLMAASLGGDGDCHVFGCIIGVLAWLRLLESHTLDWAPFPREAAHRRLKSKMFGLLFETLYSVIMGIVLAAWLDGSSIFGNLMSARLAAGALVLLAGQMQAEALQNCTSVAASSLPRGADLVGALSQPLAVSGPNLGRWVALTALAQAVAHRQQSAFPGVRTGTGMGIGADASSGAYAMPPLVAEVFGGGRLPRPEPPLGSNTAPQRAARPAALGRSSFFGAYLESGLEVIREFTVRVQCLVVAARRKGVNALLPTQVRVLNARVVELLPLARVSVVGLVGWTCLSRDLDEAGVVQREQALQRVLSELCGAHCSLRDLLLLRGILEISVGCVLSAQEEVRSGLEQLLLAFRDVGLQQVLLPPAYKRVINDLCR